MRTRPGWSGSLPATGWSSSGPNRSARATCSARVMSWSRKNSTLCCSSSALISAKSVVVAGGLGEADVAQLGADRRGERGDLDRARADGERRASLGSTVWSTTVLMVFSLLGWGCGVQAGLEDEDGGADAAAGLEVAVGLDGVVEGVALVDLDLDAAGADVVEELAGERGPLRRVGDVVGQRRAGDEQRALDGQLHRVDRRDRAGRRAEADEQAAPAERVQRAGDGGPADAVVDHRHAGAVGELADPGRDVLAACRRWCASQPWARAISAFSSVETVPITLTPSRRGPLAEDAGRRRRPRRAAGRCRRASSVRDAAQQVGRGETAHGHRGGGLERDGVGQLDQRARRP